MPNWAYGKTQFNDLDVYKKIEPVLKIDPIAMLGWQSYTSGNLEMREVKEAIKNLHLVTTVTGKQLNVILTPSNA